MAIDIFILAIIAFLFFKGYRKGLIKSLFSAIALLLGMIVALTFAQKLSSWLLEEGYVQGVWAPLISYLILFIGVLWLVKLLGKALDSAAKVVMLGWMNRLLGGLLFSLAAAVLASIFIWLAQQMNLLKPETMAASAGYEWVAPLAPLFFKWVGVLLPFAQTVFEELQLFFKAIHQQMAWHVGSY